MPKVSAMIDDTTVRLLTVLNAVSSKRPIEESEINAAERPVKLNRKKATLQGGQAEPAIAGAEEACEGLNAAFVLEDREDLEAADANADLHTLHFGPESKLLTSPARESVEKGIWESEVSQGRFGQNIISRPSSSSSHEAVKRTVVHKLEDAASSMRTGLSSSQQAVLTEMWDLVSSYQDVFLTKTTLNTIDIMRSTTSFHILNHVHKIRRRILKNNERIAHAPPDSPADNIQDQGFTRPSVLILLPFRSFVVRWLDSLIKHLSGAQVENHSRFTSEFGLPEGVVDKLTAAEPGTYPPDHVAMFQGNIDDDFRLGIKLTRKSIKLFSEFYSSDIIIASPFGLRRAIEADGGDFLSSIEMLVIDQVDAISMQNWDHLLFCLSNLNQLPKASHDTDFSRVKPWFLDGHAKYLRQSIMLSPYENPEMRALFNSYSNVAGKIRTRSLWPALAVPEGIKQTFSQFECNNPQSEHDKRFEYFTTQLFPAVMKSAVQSSNTVIFVPSYFDFVRVRHWLRQQPSVSFAVLFEESSNADISRARHAFFSGQKQFLLTTERFHFFRRYRIRGIRNVVFYSLPEHPQFYTEYLSFPFLDEGVDASDVTVRVLFSRWDAMRLERIVGSERVKSLIGLN